MRDLLQHRGSSMTKRTYLTWRGFIHINPSDIRCIALTSSSGPKRKWTSSDALGFCMCFFSLACGGCSDRYTVRTWWAADERGRLGAVISHQEVEGQLQFLQTINELCFRGGLGSQGQHALCEQTKQRWPHARSRVTRTGHGFHCPARAHKHT